MNIIEIVEKYLKENKYVGLCVPDDCGCGFDDLMPCCEPNMNECVPAKTYKEGLFYPDTKKKEEKE